MLVLKFKKKTGNDAWVFKCDASRWYLCLRSERGRSGGCRLVQELRVHLVVMSAQVLSEQVTQDLACLITNTPSPSPLIVSTRVSSFSIPLPASGSRACLCLSTVSLLLRFVLLLLHHRLSLSSFLYFFTLVNRYEPCSSMTTLVVLSHLSS